jgi:hypothetical protein
VGIHFSQSFELKSFSDIMGFSFEKYEKQVFDACPFIDFCTKPAKANYTYRIATIKPCCAQCSCSPNCFVRQNCCIDALISTETYNLNITDYITCHTTDIKPSKLYSPRYKMIVSCPGDDGENQSCEKPIDTTQPDDLVLVSSVDGLVIFWNEDCARCHGITDIIRQVIFLNILRLNISIFDLYYFVAHLEETLGPPLGMNYVDA